VLGDWCVCVFSDGAAGEECVDGFHGGSWGWGGLCVWRSPARFRHPPTLFLASPCARGILIFF
jgi:hypothetical protein